MKAELRIADHSVRPGQKVFEVWYGGQFIAEITGADGPGVRVISKHPMRVTSDPQPPAIVTVWIGQ